MPTYRFKANLTFAASGPGDAGEKLGNFIHDFYLGNDPGGGPLPLGEFQGRINLYLGRRRRPREETK